jgi:Mrp family chromosome partitioning ATPase/capsular polysaccharide biosynthesis protein
VLWRRKLTIVVSLIVAVVAALAYSKLQTPKYQSTAVVQEVTTAASASGSSSAPVTLPDPVQELGSTAVQERAANILGEPVSSVASAVTGTADATTGLLTIVATDTSPARAQTVAKAYSEAFVAQTQALVQAQIDKVTTAATALGARIATLQNQPGASSNALIQAQITGLTNTYSTLQAEASNIQVGEPYASVQVAAAFPGAPTGLSKTKLAGIGVIAGLLVGCGIALGRDQFDTRLRASPDIGSITDAPILAELPQDQDVRSGKVSIAMVQAPQSLMAESIRELRTSLRVILDDAPCPVIVVTSPEPGDGKTFVTANLAAAWAMSGSKVIVVSADFRRPRLEDILGLETAGMPGLADLIKSNWKTPEQAERRLASRPGPRPPIRPGQPEQPGQLGQGSPAPSGDRRSLGGADPRPGATRAGWDVGMDPDRASVSSFLVESGIYGLQVLPVGTELENPAELFGSPGMQPVLDQLPLLADVVLLDTPPVLAVPDTAILGSMAHGAVVVAAEGGTERIDLERTIHRLETTNCRVLGVVVNRVRHSTTDSYQSYAYRQ